MCIIDNIYLQDCTVLFPPDSCLHVHLHGPLAFNLQSKKLDFPRLSTSPVTPQPYFPISQFLWSPFPSLQTDASSLGLVHQAPCPNTLLLQSPLVNFVGETESFVLYTARARRLGRESAVVSLHALLGPVPDLIYCKKSPALQADTLTSTHRSRSELWLQKPSNPLLSICRLGYFLFSLIFVFSWKILNLFKMQFHVNNKEHRLDTSVTPAKFYVSVSNH